MAIDMPYASFDLVASPPLAASGTRFFPLRRADNDTEYTLGRAFLQNAYVIANYEYFNFSVQAAQYPSTSVSQRIVTLPAKPGTTVVQTKSSGLSTGAIVGIAIGAVAAILILGAIMFFVFRKRKEKRYNAVPNPDHRADSKYQPQTDPNVFTGYRQELPDNSQPVYEVDGAHQHHEMDALGAVKYPPYKSDAPAELPADIPAQEMDTPQSSTYPTPTVTPSTTPGSRRNRGLRGVFGKSH